MLMIRTEILVFDSLGTNHSTIITNLMEYLKSEAQHKKGDAGLGDMIGRTALVCHYKRSSALTSIYLLCAGPQAVK